MVGRNLRALWDDPRPERAPGPGGRDWALVAVFAAWSVIEVVLREVLPGVRSAWQSA